MPQLFKAAEGIGTFITISRYGRWMIGIWWEFVGRESWATDACYLPWRVMRDALIRVRPSCVEQRAKCLPEVEQWIRDVVIVMRADNQV